MTTEAKKIRPDISADDCAYSKALEIISNKWTVLVVYALEGGSVRYGEMQRRIDGISKKMLTQTVRQLERDGFVRREVTPTIPPAVAYTLTPLGESLLRPLSELKRWLGANLTAIETAREAYDGRLKDEG